MKRRLIVVFFISLTFPFFLLGLGPLKPAPPSGSNLKLNANYGQLPLAFEPNQGQTDSQVQYLSHGGGYTLFLTSGEAVLVLQKPQTGPHSKFSMAKEMKKGGRVSIPSAPVSQTPPVTLRMKMVGAQSGRAFQGMEQLPGISNYLIGNDPSKWHTHVPQYAKVQAEEIYPGVDMVYYGNQRRLEYDFVVKPGADPKSIHLKYEGAKGSAVNAQGDLELQVDGGKVAFKSPKVYQEREGQRTEVNGHYRMERDGGVGFEVKDYDKTKPLVIDPVLDYSTYLGGDNTDGGFGIAVDGSGDAYVTGYSASTNFPTTSEAFQTASEGSGQSVFVTELNPTGTALVYSTYLGGSNCPFNSYNFISNAGYSIGVDGSGDAYVTGYTCTTDFPTTPGSFQTAPEGEFQFGFVTELNPTGTGFVYSTYLGSDSNSECYAIAVDGSGDAYVTGWASGTFPTTSGAFITSGNGAFVTKLNASGTGLVYSTFLGGISNEGNGIAVDGNGDAYVTGCTDANFPTTSGAFQTSDPDTSKLHAFVTELNPTGSAQVYSTYLGGTGYIENTDMGPGDFGLGIAVDGSGDAYVTGYTFANHFPTTSGAFQMSDPGTSDSHAFVTELNPTGTAPVYSTYLGGSNYTYTSSWEDEAFGIAVDGNGDAYVTGLTLATNFPTTAGAFQISDPSINQAAFVTELNSTGSALAYSTFLRGYNPDWGQSIALDGSGSVYVTGLTYGINFPTTSGAFQASAPVSAGGDAFITKFDASVFLTSTPTLTPTNTITNTCTPTLSPSPCVAWARNDGTFSSEFAAGVAIDGNGNVFTAGSFFTPVDGILTTEYSNSGSFIRAVTFCDGADDIGTAITTDSLGNFYVGGASYSNAILVKYNSMGIHQKTIMVGGGQVAGIAVDGAGNLFVTDAYNGFFTIKFDSSGNLKWINTYNSDHSDQSNGIALDSGGNVYVTGFSGSVSQTWLRTFKFDTNGNPLWGTGGVTYSVGPSAIVNGIGVDGFGNAYVCTTSQSVGVTFDYKIIKYDSLGNRQWVSDYPMGISPPPASIAVDSAGNSYLSGGTSPSSSGVYITMKYDTNGVLKWVVKDNGGTFSDSVAVDGNGYVYAVGSAAATATSNFRTVKYDPSCAPAASPTNTTTLTATSTFIPTNSPTATTTPDPSDTPSCTPTATLSNTPTVTVTETSSDTATPDPSDTPTSTNTQTNTSTDTQTVTPTETPTSTLSDTPTDTPTNSPTATLTVTPTATFTVTQTATPSTTPTATLTNTPVDTSTLTPSPTATFLLSPHGKLTLAPNIVSGMKPICLYLDKPASESQWTIYDLAGERVAHLEFGKEQACWNHPNLASGLYLIRVQVGYEDGTTGDRIFKVVFIR